MQTRHGSHEIDDDPARVDRDAVWSFLSGAYWNGTRTREEFDRQVDGAWRVVAAYDSATGALHGFARAVSDGVSIAYLADVFVLPDARGSGLGTAVVTAMVDEGPGAHLRWLLHTRDAHGLYARFGFAPPDDRLLERPRDLLRRPAPDSSAMAGDAGTADPSPEPIGSRAPVDSGLARPAGLSYLHIPAVDVHAAAEFYAAVFGWVIRGRDTDRPGFDDGTGHVSGAWTTELPVSREPGLLPFVHVDAIDDVLDRIRTRGGEVVSSPSPEGSLSVATFRDPAGNVLGLWHDEAS